LFGFNGDASKLQVGHILNAAKLPTTGKPNSKVKTPDGKQEREYGPNGKAKKIQITDILTII